MRIKSAGSEHVWSEKPRELVDAIIIDSASKPIHFHDWGKTNGFTLKNGLGYYDAMKCSLCGITGK